MIGERRSTAFGAEARSNAPTRTEFEALYDAARDREDSHERLESQWILLAAGRLGLRRSEIAHMQASWVNWKDKRIEVPAHEPCSKGVGECVCSRCRDKAEDSSREDLAQRWWHPATPAAVRGVPFGWSPRIKIVLERFCERYDEFHECAGTINRRIRTAAERTSEVEVDETTPLSLRTAATLYHAGRGLDPSALQALMGWETMLSASVHIRGSDESTQRELREVHSR